jgi:hypothetical protein
MWFNIILDFGIGRLSAPTLETLWCLRSIFGKKVLRR